MLKDHVVDTKPIHCPVCKSDHSVKQLGLKMSEDERYYNAECPILKLGFPLTLEQFEECFVNDDGSRLNGHPLKINIADSARANQIAFRSRQQWLKARQLELLSALVKFHEAGDYHSELVCSCTEELHCNAMELALTP